MRFHEIIAPIAETTITKPKPWADRHAEFQRQQAKLTSARAKLATARASADRHRRQAADRQQADHGKLRQAQAKLATVSKPAG